MPSSSAAPSRLTNLLEAPAGEWEADLRRRHAKEVQAGRERPTAAAGRTRIGRYEWKVVTGETLWTVQVA